MSAYPKHTPVLLLYYVSLMTLPYKGTVFLYPENPWLCQGYKEALAMSRKREPPML